MGAGTTEIERVMRVRSGQIVRLPGNSRTERLRPGGAAGKTAAGQRTSVVKTGQVVIGIAFAVAATSQASAAHATKSKEKAWRAPPPYERAERDCTPINGRFGYYGNPWCDTGSSRPPDIEFRQRQRLRYR